MPLSDNDLINLLAHEICHIFQEPLSKTTYFENLIAQGFTNAYMRNHVLTFAILKEVLDPEQYLKSIEKITKGPYKEAVDFVETKGAKNIIVEAKSHL